jgi:hypothetical protein
VSHATAAMCSAAGNASRRARSTRAASTKRSASSCRRRLAP